MTLFQVAGRFMLTGASEAERDLDNLDNKGSKVGSTFANAGKVVAGAGVAIGASMMAIGTKALKAGSDAEEMRGKFQVVFGDLEDDVRGWAEETANRVGRSQVALEGFLAETQNMLVGMGSTREEGAELSQQIVALGVDLASFNNLAEDNALASLQSAISGNHNASKALGAVLNENTLAMAMERMEIQGKFQDLDEVTKMQVRYEAIVMQSEDALGDAERTSGSFANTMRALKGTLADVMVELGNKLLPTATNFLNVIRNNIPQIQAVLFGLFDMVGAGATKIWEMFNTYVYPVIEKLVPLISGVVDMVMGSFTDFFDGTSETFTDIFNIIMDVFNGIVEFVMDFVERNRELIESIHDAYMQGFTAIKDVVQGVVNLIATIWENHGEKITAVVRWFLDVVARIFEGVLWGIVTTWQIISAVLNGDWKLAWTLIKDFFSDTWDRIKGLGELGMQAILAVIGFFGEQIGKVWGKIWDGMKNIVQGVWDGIVSGIESSINWVIDKINAFIRVVNGAIEQMNKVPGVNVSTIGMLGSVSLGRDTTNAWSGTDTSGMLAGTGGGGGGRDGSITIHNEINAKTTVDSAEMYRILQRNNAKLAFDLGM